MWASTASSSNGSAKALMVPGERRLNRPQINLAAMPPSKEKTSMMGEAKRMQMIPSNAKTNAPTNISSTDSQGRRSHKGHIWFSGSEFRKY
jgi:hypothetical protein